MRWASSHPLGTLLPRGVPSSQPKWTPFDVVIATRRLVHLRRLDVGCNGLKAGQHIRVQARGEPNYGRKQLEKRCPIAVRKSRDDIAGELDREPRPRASSSDQNPKRRWRKAPPQHAREKERLPQRPVPATYSRHCRQTTPQPDASRSRVSERHSRPRLRFHVRVVNIAAYRWWHPRPATTQPQEFQFLPAVSESSAISRDPRCGPRFSPNEAAGCVSRSSRRRRNCRVYARGRLP
jgi:hypothetical protein